MSDNQASQGRDWDSVIIKMQLQLIILISGLPDMEIVNCWLTDLRFEEYFGLFAAAGYDIFTISRM